MGLKRHKHEEHENHERWLVSYADFMTLMFAFFVVLYATSQKDDEKEEKFQESIRERMQGAIGFGMPGASFSMDSESTSPISNPIGAFPDRNAGNEEVEDHVERRLKRDLKEEEYESIVEGIRHDSRGVQIQLAASQIFPTGSADVNEKSVSSLDKIGELLKDSRRKIVIEGHTDSDPITTRRYPSNWELSAARATKIARYMTQRMNIDPSRVVVVAYGSNKPLVPNDTAENKAKNRRIEITIVNSDEKSGF